LSTVIASDLDDKVEFEHVPSKSSSGYWMNYIWGVMHAFKVRGLDFQPFNAIIQSEVPVGAGLSSSAALEVVFAKAFNELFHFNLSDIELTLIAKEAENNYVGLQCGIMDMFASVHARKDMAIKLDCRNLDFEYVSLQLKTNKILLIDTCIKHELASSEYNQRRHECDSVVFKLNQQGIQATSLRDISRVDLDAHRNIFSDKEYQRASYVIEENNRLHQFVVAISKNDWTAAGALLCASHEGLKNKYQVSCEALDQLVDWCKSSKGVWGGRMKFPPSLQWFQNDISPGLESFQNIILQVQVMVPVNFNASYEKNICIRTCYARRLFSLCRFSLTQRARTP
jgi:galactokinase